MTADVGTAPLFRGHPLLGVGPEIRRDMFGTILAVAALGPVVRFRVPPDRHGRGHHRGR